MNKRKTGTFYEKQAARYLESRGYEILWHSYRCRFGEIDLVARDGAYLVFVEVKYRSGRAMGEGSCAAAFLHTIFQKDHYEFPNEPKSVLIPLLQCGK